MKRIVYALLMVLLVVAGAAPALAQIETSAPALRLLQMERGVTITAHRVTVQIVDQVATTRIEQVFANRGDRMAEGTYIFPLPVGAAVSDLVMWANGERIEAKILDAGQARDIYDEIVRRMRDPALLEYIGAGAIQASVFPIQPFSEVKIEIEYGQLVTAENGLVNYRYPLRTDHLTRQPVEQISISVQVESKDAISTIYSPTHPVAISRNGDFAFRAGYEGSYVRPETDFSLYYGLANDEIAVNLLTYRESANQDGFFTLMITPPVSVTSDRVIPKDVIVVLDQSGSMFGPKWDQAREAVKFVLDHLNPSDRFNVVVFSTGYRIFANDLQPVGSAGEAKQWVDGLEALGGTDIDGALKEAMRMSDPARSTVVLFLTDGLPTEGETDAGRILENVKAAAPANVRVFSFGVGDDVDTFLLDQLTHTFRGAGTYVRPDERIDEEVSSLYNKISAPVLTNIALEVDGVIVEDLYPAAPLGDLFVGTQLIITGRYRGDGVASIRLTGDLEGEQKAFGYEATFRANAGGEVFIPRLWATRKIGALLNAIRLQGENPELVDSIVRLSIRYGIITPYTSFLITEDDIFSQTGREEAQTAFQSETDLAFSAPSGSAAVNAAEAAADMAGAAAPMPAATLVPSQAMREAGAGDEVGYGGGDYQQPMQYAGDRTFVWRDGVWIDTLFNSDEMEPVEVGFLSDAYFDLLDLDPMVGEFLALGEQVLFVWEGTAYQIVAE